MADGSDGQQRQQTLAFDRERSSSMLQGKTVYLVDAYNLIFQVFHALPEMTSPRGEPVNAVYGFTRDLFYLLDEKKPDYLVVVFDAPGDTFRHEVFSDYKVHRAEMPEDLIPQIAIIRRVVDVLGIPVVELPGYEADDIIATLARQAEEQGAEVYVVTSDKDCRQLITDHVKLYNVRKDQVYDREALAADWGIRPDQVVDFQALVGDPVDNVPGVPLIGPKLARQLLETYGSLDQVLDRADEVSGKKRRENLIQGREQALMSRELVRLDTHVPIEFDWSKARVRDINVKAAAELFRELGFRRLTQRMSEADGSASTVGNDAAADDPSDPASNTTAASTGTATASNATAEAAATAAATTARGGAAEWKADYQLINTPERFEQFLAELRQQRRISVDTETTSRSPTTAEIVGYSFCWEPGKAYYLPVSAPEGERVLDAETTHAALAEVLEDERVEKIGQNLKYDMIVLRGVGIRLRGTAFDTMIASYLLDAGARNHGLDELARRHLNHQNIKISDLIGTGRKQKRMDEVPLDRVTPYAAEDADVPLRLAPILSEQLKQAQLDELFSTLELPLVDVLAEMEHNGIRIDVPRLRQLSQEFGTRVEQLREEIFELAGGEFNVDSPKQLQKILFEELSLPVIRRTQTGASTDAKVLEKLASHHPLPAKVLEYRQFAKLKNTYVDALPELVNPNTGRIHCSFHQTVTATGRLSSSEPNLQNIPIRSDSGRAIRSAFLPGHDDWMLLAADYSQIELRVLAHFSGDETLCASFAADEDIHRSVAAEVFGVLPDEVTPEMRRRAKAVNFGVVYGQSAFGLADSLGISKEAAAEFIDTYFARYPGVEEFLSKVLEECRARGYVKTILGRRRAIEGVRNIGGRSRNLSERTAINTVIQGSAADLIKKAMIAIHARLQRERLDAKMLLQIHDELVFEVPSSQLDEFAALVTTEMTEVMNLNVPLKVDLKSGPTWADAE